MNCWEVCKYDVLSLVLQVKVSLDSLMDGLTGLSDIGDCVARVEHLLKELKALEEKARVGKQHRLRYELSGLQCANNC